MGPQRLWIVCPVYDAVESFLILRAAILHELDGSSQVPSSCRTSFVVIDDTAGQDREVARLHGLPDVIVLPTPFNLGHQRALVFGLRSLAGEIDAADWIVTLDADGEDRPADISRLIEPLAAGPAGENRVVLAWRTRRRESWWFKTLYLAFKIAFRVLTGTVIRTGNYAAFQGQVARQVLRHPAFDWSYASAFLSLNVPVVFVPCERATRYAGQSKMGLSRLIMHGLRMLMPFLDRIATRALIGFGLVFIAGLLASVSVAAVALCTSVIIPRWTLLLLLAILMVSFSALGNFVILFVVFAQSGAFSLSGIRDQVLRLPVDALDVKRT